MFENIAAIDIGSSSIKVITVKTGFRDFQVTSIISEDINQDIEDNNEAIRNALVKILNENSFKGYRLITNLPMERAIIRNITFPFKDIEKIAEAIPFEAEENVPFKIDELIMDFQSLKSKNPDEGRVLLAATQKEKVRDFLGLLSEFELQPVKMGLESNSLFECYRYFNKIDDESVLQIDIGNSKTIVNVISENNLLYTRCVTIGINHIYYKISEKLKISYIDAKNIFDNLHIDLTSLDNNIQREHYKSLKINKAKLKNIYDSVIEILKLLVEQIILTLKSFAMTFEELEFNRAFISGGGSNITGIGKIISEEMELPVAALPFLEEYAELNIQAQFPVVFGAVLSYMNRRSSVINFLKGEFVPDIVGTSRKIYYLSGAFAVLTVLVLAVNLITSSILKSETNAKYEEILLERFKKYFPKKEPKDDPVKEASKILKKEKEEFANLRLLINPEEKVLEVFQNLISSFPQDESFELQNLVINERVLRIDGTIGSSKNIDDFKNKLIESRNFSSVNLNTNIHKAGVRFSMNIKLKVTEQKKDALNTLKKGTN